MRNALISLVVFLTVNVAAAGEVTKPIRYTWIVTACETWNCAAAALVMANGDQHVIVLPTGRDEHPWLTLRRVEEGALSVPETEPFGCEVFEAFEVATTRFHSLDRCLAPIVLTVPDGRTVVLSLKKCDMARRRAVR